MEILFADDGEEIVLFEQEFEVCNSSLMTRRSFSSVHMASEEFL